jgi:putative ribosome biogenesis GTPase RsgA
MTPNINKYSKKELIDIILIYYMKYNIKIEINLNKLNKNKLLDIINTQQIPIYNQIELVKEILDIEKYINNLEKYNSSKYLYVYGETGIGKTTIIKNILVSNGISSLSS